MSCMFGILEVLLRSRDLCLQQRLLVCDARQQGVEVARGEIGGRLQLVIEEVGEAVVVELGHDGSRHMHCTVVVAWL